MNNALPIDSVLEGDCIDVLARLPDESVDLIFADPPYNLQLRQDLYRPNQTRVDAVTDAWDQFQSFQEYDNFSRAWLSACRRVLKPNGTLWAIGMYHNIHRVGALMQDLDYWILNSIVWVKANPMPNFRGVRFTNAHELLIWAQKQAGAPYTFNHHAMRALNEDLQMRSDWYLPVCSGRERLRVNGVKAHATQKPEALLYRVILASSNPGDVVLDPFFGTGTTGVVASRLQRHWIGIEKDPQYVELARRRIADAPAANGDAALFRSAQPRRAMRLPFGALLEAGLLNAGQVLHFGPNGGPQAVIMADGSLEYQQQRGSIHKIARLVQPGASNGWHEWFYQDELSQQYYPIDRLRQHLRAQIEDPTIKEILE